MLRIPRRRRAVLAIAALTAAACAVQPERAGPADAPIEPGDAASIAPDAAPPGLPRLAWRSIRHQATLEEGEALTHEFVLQNTGTGVLHIKRAKGS